MPESIQKADEFVRLHAREVNPEFLPKYHVTPPVGWINDPNGFCHWRGQYHMFCQFYPYRPVWGPMHWGHWVSRDLVRWDWVGVALAPDSPFDDQGCFSGTALPDGDRLILMYTGVHKNADGVSVQEQCIAETTDGVHFTKWACNPVIGAKDLPEGSSPRDFRDPKIMRTDAGYRAIVANKGETNGRQLSFSSSDLKHWTCDGVFLEGIGDMPECPDYFELDGKNVMITCAIGMQLDGLRFPGTQPVVYITGRESGGRLVPEVLETVDHGREFYAPETVLTPDGRRVIVGWLNMWGCETPTQKLGHGWCGMYTIPRELSVRGGYLYQKPLEELKSLRGEEFGVRGVQVDGETEIDGLNGRHYELTLDITPTEGNVEIRLMRTGGEYFAVRYNPATRIIECDRTRGGHKLGDENTGDTGAVMRANVPGARRDLHLDIFVDTCSVEVFVNGGAATLSMLNYPKGDAQGISFAGRFAIDELNKWELA